MNEENTNMVIEELKQSEALLEGHFLLSSGRHSDRYCQCAKLLQYPDRAERVIAKITEQVKGLGLDMVVLKAFGAEVIGVACIADRSDGSFPYPVYSATKLNIQNWAVEDCPLCKQGLPFVKPGSRKM